MTLTDLRRERAHESDRAAPVPFDEAFRRMLDLAKPLGSERIPLREADDRVLWAPAIAQRSAPLVAVSAMDGFAVRDADVVNTPARLTIVGRSFAGKPYEGTVGPGECVRIFTGAAPPPDTDRVVIQEDVAVSKSTAIIASPPGHRRHVRAAGSDFRHGQIVVPAGRRIRPQDLIAAAAADLDEVEVFRRPRVHILCCGDELVPSGTAKESANRTPESISIGVAALIARSGGIVTGHSLLPDALGAMRLGALGALRSADVVVTIGGASVGERDFAKAAFAPLGISKLFDKVAIKPGKPVWLGHSGGVPILGLPGNPTSALVTARLFLAPLIAGLAGRDPLESLQWRTGRFDGAIERSSDRDVFVRARMVDGRVIPLSSQDSADQKALADADTLVRLRPGPDCENSGEALVEIVDF
jgi:molybdopterin molybdotransferase